MRAEKLELLAPAGNFDTLKAVIEAGADAVYLGGPAFGARAYAGNFTQDELISALDYAHLRDRKIYLTVNTLMKNREIAGLEDYLKPFYEHGLDAVLVQDFGALTLIHEKFPDLPIHTSTQMTVTGVEGIRFLQKYGVTRVVMAREVSLAEMKKMHEETGMELEAFVHGALCYCYSGQCLFSSMLGGRSGNRGRCAQPCRLSYSALDESRKEYHKEDFCLSLKDLCGISDLNELYDSGVYSLKIEGRMKSAQYAAGVVSVYRKAVDAIEAVSPSKMPAASESLRKLESLGSRCGFTDRYYHAHNGREMVTFRKPNFEAGDPSYAEQVTERYVNYQKKIPVTGKAVFKKGQPARMTVSAERASVTVESQPVTEAMKNPAEKDAVLERLKKTGDTPFVFEGEQSLALEMDADVFLPNGVLNHLRRDALDALLQKLLESHMRTQPVSDPETGCTSAAGAVSAGRQPLFTVSCETRKQLEAVMKIPAVPVIYADYHIYLPDPSVQIAEAAAAFRLDRGRMEADGRKLYLRLPAVLRREAAEDLQAFLDNENMCPPDGFVIRNFEELGMIRKLYPDLPLVIDHNMYTYNNIAADAFRKAGGNCRITVPLELNGGEIANRDNRDSEIVIYGRYPLMITAGCVRRNTKGCDRTPSVVYLKDRYKAEFPVKNYCRECTNVIYNSLPTDLTAEISDLKKAGIRSFRAEFTTENAVQCAEIIAYGLRALGGKSRGEKLSQAVTKGHYKRGVE